jgi:hypothetical protein
MADNSGIPVIPEPPPPRAVAYAVLAFILNLLAVGALVLEQCTLGTWLAVGALVFSGLTVYALVRSGGSGGLRAKGTTPTGTTSTTGTNPAAR